MATRCRLCTTNDRDALIAEIAQAIWEREGHRDWSRASPQWRLIYTQLAMTMLDVMEERHFAHDQ